MNSKRYYNNSEWRELYLERQRARDKIYYAKCRRLGLCRSCTNQSEKFTQCVECRLKRSKAMKKRYIPKNKRTNNARYKRSSQNI